MPEEKPSSSITEVQSGISLQEEAKEMGPILTREEMPEKANETSSKKPSAQELTTEVLGSTEQLIGTDSKARDTEGIRLESLRIPAIQSIGHFLQVLVIESQELIRGRNETE